MKFSYTLLHRLALLIMTLFAGGLEYLLRHLRKLHFQNNLFKISANKSTCCTTLNLKSGVWVIWSILSGLIQFHSTVIRQKSKSQNRCFIKQSTSNFPKDEHFLPPDTRRYVSDTKFFEKFGVLCFLETPVLRFALLPLPTNYGWKLFSYILEIKA